MIDPLQPIFQSHCIPNLALLDHLEHLLIDLSLSDKSEDGLLPEDFEMLLQQVPSLKRVEYIVSLENYSFFDFDDLSHVSLHPYRFTTAMSQKDIMLHLSSCPQPFQQVLLDINAVFKTRSVLGVIYWSSNFD
jgi:hypothetical protein